MIRVWRRVRNIFGGASSPETFYHQVDGTQDEIDEYDRPRIVKSPQTGQRLTFNRVVLAILSAIVILLLAARSAPIAQPWIPTATKLPLPKPRALVLASYGRQDSSWLERVPDNYDVYRYLNDDANPAHELTIPRQQGREAMTYLTYIIDHYDRLSDITFFLHGDERSWHMPESVLLKLAAINTTALEAENFINMRCNLFPACTEETIMGVKAQLRSDDDRAAAHMLPAFFKTMFPPERDWAMGGDNPPEVLASACCSQFAVTKAQLLSRPKEFYEFYRKPLLRDLNELKDMWGQQPDSYAMGVIYERFWHMLFGRPAYNCVDPNFCQRVHFQDAIECDRDTTDPAVNEDWQDIKCQLRPGFS